MSEQQPPWLIPVQQNITALAQQGLCKLQRAIDAPLPYSEALATYLALFLALRRKRQGHVTW
jgi:hypothetical protein